MSPACDFGLLCVHLAQSGKLRKSACKTATPATRTSVPRYVDQTIYQHPEQEPKRRRGYRPNRKSAAYLRKPGSGATVRHCLLVGRATDCSVKFTDSELPLRSNVLSWQSFHRGTSPVRRTNRSDARCPEATPAPRLRRGARRLAIRKMPF
jgi:hypothetical protein